MSADLGNVKGIRRKHELNMAIVIAYLELHTMQT